MDSELKQYLDEFSQRTDAQFQQMREENAAAHEKTRRVLRGEMAEMAGSLRGEMAEMASSLRGEMGEMTGTLREEIAEAVSTLRRESVAAHEETRRILRTESVAAHEETRRILRTESVTAHEETRRHFDIVAEGMESRFGVLAEHVESLDRDVAEIKRRTR